MKQALTLLLILCSCVASAQDLHGTWKGALKVQGMKLRLVYHIDKDDNGKDICSMDSPDQSANGIPGDILHLSADSLNLTIQGMMDYRGRLVGDSIVGVFSQAGMNFPLTLSRGGVTMNRPQTPTPPYPYATEEVTFTNKEAGVTLAGTLSMPVGYGKGEQVPVLLMVTGSGPQNRDSELFGHKTFLVIADHLARHGIATLRYDDRNVGESKADSQAATTVEVADDAKAGLEYLRGRKEFSKVGLLGHSEGGTVAFMLGAKGLTDFIVSMAGPGVKGEDVLWTQAQKITELSGQPAIAKEDYIKTVESMQNPWIDYFMKYDPTEDIKNTKCPVFALNGDKDVQVIASHNLTAIMLKQMGNKNAKIKYYPNLNHLFQPCETGLPNEYADIETTVSPEVLEDIANWVKATFQ